MSTIGKKSLLAPNGKQSNLTAEQHKLVRTTAFKKWFGDWENDPENASKVVDKNGEPMVVYHGTNQKFTIFSLEKVGSNVDYGMWGSGFYFSPVKSISKSYGINLLKLFLNIRNPFVRNPNLTGSITRFKPVFGREESIKLRSEILGANYYGVMQYESGQKNILFQIIAFHPNQIKLADGSNTTFDGSNPDIRYKKGGRTISQTPSPKKDRIYGSKVNKKGSASSEKSAKSIKLSSEIISSLSKKLKEFKENHDTDKVSLNDLKAVYRRGLGAYSSSHRPTISGGKPNTRNAWAMARVNAFLRKAGGGEHKKAYVQDDDLLKYEGGALIPQKGTLYTKDKKSKLEYYKKGNDYSFKVYDVENNNVENEVSMNYNQFKNYLYTELYIDDKNAEGGETGQQIVCVNCGWEWNTNDSEDYNKYICKCGFNNRTFYDSDPIGFKEGGEVEDKKKTYDKWKSLVNMSSGELKKFYESEDGKKAGLSSSEANKQGIDSGRESARWIIRMKQTPKSKWTPEMWRWAKKQISFISRMSGVKGGLYKPSGEKTRKHLALLIWGHNPKKYDMGGNIISLPDTSAEFERLREILDQQGYTLSKKDTHLLKVAPSLDQIAEKHHVSKDYLEDQLEMGIKEEMEHTDVPEVAQTIALHHLYEDFKYYSHLEEMMQKAKEEEEYDRSIQEVIANHKDSETKRESKVFKHSKKFGEITIYTNVEQEYVGNNYSPFESKGSFKASVRKGDLVNIAIESQELKDFDFKWGIDDWDKISKKLKEKKITELELYEVGKYIKTYELRPIKNENNFKMSEDFENGGVVDQSKLFDRSGVELKIGDKVKYENYFYTLKYTIIGTIIEFKEESSIQIKSSSFGKIPQGNENVRAKVKVLEKFSANNKKIRDFQKTTYIRLSNLSKIDGGVNEISPNNISLKKGGEIDPDNKQIKEAMTHKSGSAGGLLVGNRHSEGGIKAINKSTDQPLEMEGGEIVITRNAVSDDKKRMFEGKMLTNREILSKINESGGGVSFDKGGKVESDDNDCGCNHYEDGGSTEIVMFGIQYPELTPSEMLDKMFEDNCEIHELDNVYDKGGLVRLVDKKVASYKEFLSKNPNISASAQKKSYKNYLSNVHSLIFDELPQQMRMGLLLGNQKLINNYLNS